MHCTWLGPIDNALDYGGNVERPLNPLPERCTACGFPELNFVPQPYRLQKARAMTPSEFRPAAYGNVLVRDRVRQVLDTVVPGACTFYPTVLGKEEAPSPWWLAVPTKSMPVSEIVKKVPRCTACGEPVAAHGSQVGKWLLGDPSDAPYDIFRSRGGISNERGWRVWADGQLFLSLRLIALLERLGVKGADVNPNSEAPAKVRAAEHRKWVDAQLVKLEAAGVATRAAGTLSPDVAKAFKAFVKQAKAATPTAFDRQAAEKRLKIKLPPSAVDYFKAVKPQTFTDVDGIPGFTARLLAPAKWDGKTYRNFDSEDNGPSIDGILFATTDHGDCFCLDVSGSGKEFPVCRFEHEGGYFEPYADSFAECVLRFAAADAVEG